MISALFVHKNGAYFGLPDVDPWDEERDARLYRGPHPVVAHPPCQRWINLGVMNYARWGGDHNRPGNDGGCFKSALDSVRRWGGVLEHPAYSKAWPTFGLPRPEPGGWRGNLLNGWVCQVEQAWYGHPARKRTWLYACKVTILPELQWGVFPKQDLKAQVSWCKNHTNQSDPRKRVGKDIAAATPTAFRDLLLSLARSVEP